MPLTIEARIESVLSGVRNPNNLFEVKSPDSARRQIPSLETLTQTFNEVITSVLERDSAWAIALSKSGKKYRSSDPLPYSQLESGESGLMGTIKLASYYSLDVARLHDREDLWWDIWNRYGKREESKYFGQSRLVAARAYAGMQLDGFWLAGRENVECGMANQTAEEFRRVVALAAVWETVADLPELSGIPNFATNLLEFYQLGFTGVHWLNVGDRRMLGAHSVLQPSSRSKVLGCWISGDTDFLQHAWDQSCSAPLGPRGHIIRSYELPVFAQSGPI